MIFHHTVFPSELVYILLKYFFKIFLVSASWNWRDFDDSLSNVSVLEGKPS